MLKVLGISKSFKEKKAVEDLSFEVLPGAVLGLLGPNGAGKSTSLNSISGILRPDAGEVWICGQSVKTSALEAKKNFGYLSDPPMMLQGTCWENMVFIAEVFGVRDFEAKANALLQRFNLLEEKDKPVLKFSKGMNQRLALAMLFLHSPKVILLDEPTTGLDPAGIAVMNELIRESAAAGSSIVISSHLLGILETICSDILVMDKGKTVLSAPLSELKAKKGELARNPSLEEIFLEAVKAKAAA